MGIFQKRNEKKLVENLVITLFNFRAKAFDADFEKKLYGDTSKMSDIEKSYLWFSHVFTEMMEKVDIEKYNGLIDDELFSIAKEAYYNLCLFVDGLVKIDEIVLGHTRPSLLMLLDKTHKVYEYQMDITGDNVEKLFKKMKSRVKELYPEIDI